MYLEMSRDEAHGGGDWGFPMCLWVPTRKRDDTQWVFWSKILDVRTDDVVLHLRSIPPHASFIGYSIARSDGYEATQRPPNAGPWSYAQTFYRADLDQYTAFSQPIKLADVFSGRRLALEQYFDANRSRSSRSNVFFVRQAGRLQCLNGAYLSDVDEDLFSAIFDAPAFLSGSPSPSLPVTVATGQQLAKIITRIGQASFSSKIKELYGGNCCFPACKVSDPRFLVGSHIARWSDNEGLRGHLGNGLCFCLMHDKAFELGLFTMDAQFRVYVHPKLKPDTSFAKEILGSNGARMKLAKREPLIEALSEHWRRVNLSPSST
jgi:putative restriction endonuclease